MKCEKKIMWMLGACVLTAFVIATITFQVNYHSLQILRNKKRKKNQNFSITRMNLAFILILELVSCVDDVKNQSPFSAIRKVEK